MENIKLKTVETITPMYPDGVIMIKEDTDVEYPIAVVSFPIGGHKEGMKKQREQSKLMAAAPVLLKTLKNLTKAVEPLNDKVLGNSYKAVVYAYAEARELLDSLSIDS